MARSEVPESAGRVAIVRLRTRDRLGDAPSMSKRTVVLAVRNLVKGNDAADRIKAASPNATSHCRNRT